MLRTQDLERQQSERMVEQDALMPSLSSSLLPSLHSNGQNGSLRAQHISYTTNTRILHTQSTGGVTTRTVTETHNSESDRVPSSSPYDDVFNEEVTLHTERQRSGEGDRSRTLSFISATSDTSGADAELDDVDEDSDTPPIGKQIISKGMLLSRLVHVSCILYNICWL